MLIAGNRYPLFRGPGAILPALFSFGEYGTHKKEREIWQHGAWFYASFVAETPAPPAFGARARNGCRIRLTATEQASDVALCANEVGRSSRSWGCFPA